MPSTNCVAAEDWCNDESIGNNEILWRIINRKHIKPHPLRAGEMIASDQAYRTGEMSVFVASKTCKQKVLARWPGYSMVEFTAGFIRRSGLIIVHDPNDTDPDPGHRIVGRPDHIRKTSGKAKEIALEARWVELNYSEGDD